MTTIQVLTLTGTKIQLGEATIAELRNGLHGTLLQAGDTGYDEARQLFNAMIDKKPALIARCADTADVITCVNFARQHRLITSVRGGGHNGAGLALVDDGLVIDLSEMRAVTVNPETGAVHVGGGAVWREVDQATHPYGLAVPSGVITSTGVGGLTLGGGMGHLSRQYGLTIDSLLEAEVILADGRQVKASELENADLFWALRGGGGNFGIVTRFLFQGRPAQTVVGGPMLWELEEAPQLMRWYRDFIVDAPENVNGFFAFLTVPPGAPFAEQLHLKRMCGIVWAINDTPEQAAEALTVVREQFPPAQDLVSHLPFPALQGMFDPLYQLGLQWYWRGDFVNELSDEAIERHLEFARQLPSLHSTMHLYPVNGAVHRVGQNETAFSYRESTWSQVIVGVDPDPANAELIRDWTVAYWEALHPYSGGGAYVNFMMEEGQERVQATYRDNHPRLAAIKAKYDPDNFFRVNQNIKPADTANL
ncbi:MAG: FAD-binding oxidoreductase [Gammaproteobacteria bacterium]|nr:FAD-binding oxidoreductase [Gammaproteobacteria bacterium]